MSRKILIVREILVKSLIRDAVTFTAPVAMIGIGVLLGSVAMQWFGFIVALLLLFAIIFHASRSDSGDSVTVKSLDEAEAVIRRWREQEAGKQ